MRVGDVLRVLGEHGEVKTDVMARFRALGGSLDRWQRRDREAMADAIASAEDRLEFEARGRITAARVALRALRRQLECATEKGRAA